MRIPFFRTDRVHQDLEPELFRSLGHVLHGGLLVRGPEYQAFCAAWASYSQSMHAVGLNSGLDALTAALEALNIGPGHEVIVPAHTYIATFLAVIHVGAKPVPVECDPGTGLIDPLAINAAITSRTRAIIPVHLYGRPCDMTAIMDLAQRRGLAVVEDNAQAQGASWKGQRTGSFGIINATSFYPTKNLGALGDGGAITTNDSALAEKAGAWGNYGSSARGHHQTIGYNSRLDELQAAFLRIKLRHLDTWNQERQAQADHYCEGLSDLDVLRPPPPDGPDASSVHHVYVVRSPHRDALKDHLSERGIGTLVHYPVPIHLQPAMADRGWRKGDFPTAELFAEQGLSLPLYPGLLRAEQDAVIEAIRSFRP